MPNDSSTGQASPSTHKVEALFVGTLAPLGPREVPSGIDKQFVSGLQYITRLGLHGDHHGDMRHHGGPEKAVHHYPRDHYAAWRADGVEAAPPAFGENISTSGLMEADVCIGDIYRLGTSLLQVSQGRQPCWRLNARFGRDDMAWLVQKSGRTGWYYRVLQEGEAASGDPLQLEERLQPQWPLTRIIDLLYTRTLDMAALETLGQVPELAQSWRDLANRRVAARSVENWDRRLHDGA